MNKTLTSCLLACFLSFVLPRVSFSTETLQGAQAIIDKLQKETATPQKSPSTLLNDIAKFPKRQSGKSPEQAAKEWTELARRCVSEAGTRGDFQSAQLKWQKLFDILPDPNSWSLIQDQLGQVNFTTERQIVLWALIRYFFAYLNSDQEQQTKCLQILTQKGKTPEFQQYARSVLENLYFNFLGNSSNPATIKIALDFILDQKSHYTESHETGYSRSISIPDIVTILGEKSSREYLSGLLELPFVLRISHGEATHKLATEIAEANIKNLKVAQWSLIKTTNALKLYPLMEESFPNDTAQVAYEKQNAFTHYITALITAGNTQRAFDLLTAPPKASAMRNTIPNRVMDFMESSAVDSLIQAGHGEKLLRFYEDVLSKNPALQNAWEGYIHLAALLGKQDQMLKFTKDIVERKNLSQEAKDSANEKLSQILLAADKVDEGVALLISKLSSTTSVSDGRRTKYDNAISLIRIGRLLNRPEWIDIGVVAAKKDISMSSSAQELWELLLKLNRAPEAEAIIENKLSKTVESSNNLQNPYARFNNSSEYKTQLIGLAEIYYSAQRYDDVITLLNNAPWWGTEDIASFITEGHTPIGFIIAASLVGKKPEESTKILIALLQKKEGYDPAYELLLKLDAEKAIPVFDQLFKRDAFEERPLIWKAQYLLDQGKLSEAKSLAKQAVLIDPSDGDEGKGDRMRVYAILGKIAEKEGDTKQAEFFAGVIKSIRLSEDADVYYNAGLLTRAVEMYKQALGYFSNAYCIQSRLAIQLNRLGRYAEAEEHYRKAYELMPDSFGRMESHCFGCEHVFADPKAQTIAEKVFTQLLKERPDKPQLYYLLGYLRMEQDHYEDALKLYRKAVELDPDYINAWKQIGSMASRIAIPTKDYDETVRNLLRLDPLQRHISVDVNQTSDFVNLWQWLDTASKANTPLVTLPIYPLPASAAYMQSKNANPALQQQAYFLSQLRRESTLTPTQKILQNNVLRQIVSILSSYP